MLAIEFRYRGEKRRVWAKLESRNLTGRRVPSPPCPILLLLSYCYC